jgi:hypothetical protein
LSEKKVAKVEKKGEKLQDTYRMWKLRGGALQIRCAGDKESFYLSILFTTFQA